MALIKCPECGRERVSDTAISCPECGFAIREYFEHSKTEETDVKIDQTDIAKEQAENQGAPGPVNTTGGYLASRSTIDHKKRLTYNFIALAVGVIAAYNIHNEHYFGSLFSLLIILPIAFLAEATVTVLCHLFDTTYFAEANRWIVIATFGYIVTTIVLFTI